jgi:hypothetical protein
VSIWVFWVATSCRLAGSEEYTASTFSPDDGGSMFIRTVGIYLQVHMTSQQHRRPTSAPSLSLLSSKPASP